MQPCKTRDQPYSDASANGECSLLIQFPHGSVILYFSKFFALSPSQVGAQVSYT